MLTPETDKERTVSAEHEDTPSVQQPDPAAAAS
jgi:hypothetical protein